MSTERVSPGGPLVHCPELACAVRLASTSSAVNRGEKSSKEAKVLIGRNEQRKIVLEVVFNNARRLCYRLHERTTRVHFHSAANGRGGIEMPSLGLTLWLTNCAPRKLNVFLKSLAAKLELDKADRTMSTIQTPVVRLKRQQSGGECLQDELSPLDAGEIRRVKRLRGAQMPSPLTKKECTTPSRRRGNDKSTLDSTSPLLRPLVESPCARPVGQRAKPAESLELTTEQRAVVRAVVVDKQSICFTGAAGTGKSLVLHRIISMLPKDTTHVTAATGVAACQLGGTTIHAWTGLGGDTATVEIVSQRVRSRPSLLHRWRSARVLIVDEMSMLTASFFDSFDKLARQVRDQPDLPFGGLQLVLTGDFLQLPPVVKNADAKFCFESEAWSLGIQRVMLLTVVQRQNDAPFIDMLQRLRVGRLDMATLDTLKRTRQNDFRAAAGIVATRLCTHTSDAEFLNNLSLKQLTGDERIFTAQDSAPIPDSLEAATAPRVVTLKVGAQVMLTRNLDLARKLSNGSRGVITGFKENANPLVRFLATDEEVEIEPYRFTVTVASDCHIVRRQIPLQLAWAISIHKSQGLTLDAVEVNLSRAFAYGQAYVALSRARSLSALRVLDIEPEAVQANPRVVAWYQELDASYQKPKTARRLSTDSPTLSRTATERSGLVRRGEELGV